MRKRQNVMLSLLLIILSFCLVSLISQADDVKSQDKKTELNIQVTPNNNHSGGGDSSNNSYNSEPNNSSKNKLPSTYTPAKAIVVKNLPQTGEIITSFIIVILGLSLLMFTLGIFINKHVSENYIEMELYS